MEIDPYSDFANLFDDLDENIEERTLNSKHICNNHEYIDMFFKRCCKHCGKEE